MFKRVTVILAIAYLVSAQQAVGGNEAYNTVELESKINNLLQKLENAVNSATGKMRKELADAKNDIKTSGVAVEKKTKTALNAVTKTFQKSLDAITAKAKKAGINVDECLGADEKALLNLPSKAANVATGCVEGLVQKFTQSVDDALLKIARIVDEVLETKKSASQCLQHKNSFICMAKLVIKIGKDIIVLPIEIVKDGMAVVNLVKNVKSELAKCGSDAVSSCKNQGNALLTKISKGVENKIIHK